MCHPHLENSATFSHFVTIKIIFNIRPLWNLDNQPKRNHNILANKVKRASTFTCFFFIIDLLIPVLQFSVCLRLTREKIMDSKVVKRSPPASNKETEMLRAAMRLLLILVLLGYLMLWFMMPTNTYWHIWLPNIRKKLNSSYFGKQGLIPLVNFFPFHFWNWFCFIAIMKHMFQLQHWWYTSSPFFSLLSWAAFISIWGRDQITAISKGNYKSISGYPFSFDLLFNFI